jgi:hypothetical protein
MPSPVNIQNLISNEHDKNQDNDIDENNFKLNNDIPDTSLTDTFQSMIAKIDIDSVFTIYKTNVDSLIINENNLSMMDPNAQKHLKEQMDKFFFSEEGADDIKGYTPTK